MSVHIVRCAYTGERKVCLPYCHSIDLFSMWNRTCRLSRASEM